MFSQWLKKLSVKPFAPSLRTRSSRCGRVRPSLEALEDRCLPSVTPLDTSEFLVNTTTPRDQSHPSIAINPLDNTFVAVWEAPAGGNQEIYFQRFMSDGTPLGSQTLVTREDHNQSTPVVAFGTVTDLTAAGLREARFAVAWADDRSGDSDIWCRIFRADGAPVSPEQQVNTYATGNQQHPAIAFGNDNLAILWDGERDGDTDGIAGRFINANSGLPDLGQFIVNDVDTAGVQANPVVATLRNGYVATWESASGGDTDVYCRMLAPVLAPEFRANIITAGQQMHPAIAIAPSVGGFDFVLAWDSQGTAGTQSIYARRFYFSFNFFAAVPLDNEEFPVSDPSFDNSSHPAAAVSGGGSDFSDKGIVVTWQSNQSGNSDIYGREFLSPAHGVPGGIAIPSASILTPVFRVNTTTANDQTAPAITAITGDAATGAARVVMAWQSEGQDGDGSGVYARRYQVDLALVTATNHAPVADDVLVTTDVDTAKTITLTATDDDGDLLTYAVVTGPAHGSLIGVAPNLIYTPDHNFNGSDSFTFIANDSKADSNVATVSITVKPVNDAPVAFQDLVTTDEDTDKPITLRAFDEDGDALTYTVVFRPAHGKLSGAAPNLIYTPDHNFNGSDSFTFKVNDGTVDSSEATVGIMVTPVNDAPVANALDLSTIENVVAVDITPTGSDLEGDKLTFRIVGLSPDGNGFKTNHGSVFMIGDRQFSYTPADGYSGPDSFAYVAYDGKLDSETATVNIDVKPLTALNLDLVATTQKGALPFDPRTGNKGLFVKATSEFPPDAVLKEVNKMKARSSDAAVTVVVVLADGSFTADLLVASSSGVITELFGPGVLIQNSPALTVESGEVFVVNTTLRGDKDSPTILVQGGHLTLRNSMVQESTRYSRPAIQITGGIVDLGTAADPGGNTFNVNGAGELIRNTGPNPVSALGNTWQVNGNAPTSSYRIEDKVFHVLDAGGGGLVTWNAGNVYVTSSSGSIQRGVDAVAAGGTVNVESGRYAAYSAGAKALTVASNNGLTITQGADALDSTRMSLVVQGTVSNDMIAFLPGANGSVIVSTNLLPLGVFKPTGRVVAYGNAGNDILAALDVRLPVSLFGGAGNDLLIGTDGGAVLIGGAGNDVVINGLGADFLITLLRRGPFRGLRVL